MASGRAARGLPARSLGERRRGRAVTIAGDAARGAAATLGGQWIRFVLQLGALAVLARLLSPDDYGVVSMVLAIAGVATLLGDFGLSMASIQSSDVTDAQRNNLLWINVLLGLVLGGIVFLLAVPIAAFYGRDELVPVCQALSAVFVVNSVTAQFKAEVSRRFRFRWLAASDVLAQLVASTGAVLLALSGAGYWALVAQQLLVAVTTLVVLVIGAGWLPGLPSRTQGMRAFLGFGANTVGVQLVNYISGNADSVLIGRVWGAGALGVYDRAYQIFRMPLQQIAAPMTRVAFPVLSRMKDSPEFERYVQRAQLVLAYVMGGVFFAAAALADPIIEIALGPGWDESKTIFRILAIGGVFQALGFVYYWVFLAKALTGLQLRFSIVSRSLMVVFMAIGVVWGPIGVAIGSTAGLVLNWVVLSFFAVPRAGIDVRALLLQACRPLALGVAIVVVSLPALALTTGLGALGQLLIVGAIDLAIAGLAVLLLRAYREDARLLQRTVLAIRRR
ncbi:lipopolysaccharide biosynthesis protein [Rathayibacter sp. AY2B3]|nr:lipopolysaccharide biosynthesis protein [Rathayibacter sp. AY2B3]PPI20473.1 lipopolysaccharide biosynthesis protein [Rathayibacter sp. AY1B6]PPI27582.1 lipopolysaccharide biosynthesis protein [Rathayibacter sp. AY1B5]PPI39846.1 lipopolysaccharide biosynthesis protein [Rathayibacter sp. AY1B1]